MAPIKQGGILCSSTLRIDSWASTRVVDIIGIMLLFLMMTIAMKF